MNDPRVAAVMNQDEPCGTPAPGGNPSRGRLGRIVAICLGIALVLGSVTRFSPAQTTRQLTRWKEFSYERDAKQVAGQMTALDAAHRTGFIVLGEGQFARLSSWVVHATAPDGKEFYQGLVIYDFQDGSSILARVDTSGLPRSKQVGSIMFLAGTKRFNGITGRGTITSWTPGEGQMYAEVDAGYSVSDG